MRTGGRRRAWLVLAQPSPPIPAQPSPLVKYATVRASWCWKENQSLAQRWARKRRRTNRAQGRRKPPPTPSHHVNGVWVITPRARSERQRPTLNLGDRHKGGFTNGRKTLTSESSCEWGKGKGKPHFDFTPTDLSQMAIGITLLVWPSRLVWASRQEKTKTNR